MFNSGNKIKFIQHYTNNIATQKHCERIFNKCEPFEEQWQSDLCTQGKDTLQEMIDKIVCVRSRSSHGIVLLLRDYVKWCIQTKYPNVSDGMLQIKTIGTDKVKKYMVANPLMLQDYLNIICEPETEKTTDNIYRCYYWLAFSGVSEEDSLRIKCSDVDFENMVIHYNGLNIPLYFESIPAFKNCATLSQFVYKHPNYASSTTVYMDRANGDTLIRGIRNTPNISTMSVELSRRAKSRIDKGLLTKRLSYKHALLSGMFYKKYQLEMAGYEVDFVDEALEFTKGKEYKLDKGRNKIEAKIRQVSKDYMIDYLRWKLAFNL